MSGQPYIPGDLESDILEAYRQHVPIEQIAARIGIDPQRLQQILGLPTSQPAQQANSGDDFDLFACDRLDGQLPTYDQSPERQPLPWEKRQRDLFDQPTRDGVSER